MFNKGVLVALVLIVSGLWVVPVAANTGNTPPEFNPVCWKEEECQKTRAELLRRNSTELSENDKQMIGNGFVKDTTVCPGDGWGKCLPANVTITAISIGGQNRFLHIGDYIQTVYKFVLSIATILAAAMMVIAGVQWVTSGGNAESISTAKHRIVNALVGMFLAYTSFFILNTINPDLVNLRLPQVYLIKPQNAVPEMCSAAATSTLFAYVADTRDQKSKIDTSKIPDYDKDGISYQKMVSSAEGYCGHRFLMKDGGAAACFGGYCPNGQGCLNIDLKTGEEGPYTCQSASVFGVLVDSSLTSDSDAGILARCLTPDGLQSGYKFPYIKDAAVMEVCDTHERSNHYVLKVAAGNEHIVPDNAKNRVLFYLDPPENIQNTKCENGKSVGFLLWLNMSGSCEIAGAAAIGKNGALVGTADTESGDWVIDTQTPLSSDPTGLLLSPTDVLRGYRVDLDVQTIKL